MVVGTNRESRRQHLGRQSWGAPLSYVICVRCVLTGSTDYQRRSALLDLSKSRGSELGLHTRAHKRSEVPGWVLDLAGRILSIFCQTLDPPTWPT